jgi:hypothetical protein
MERLTKVEVVGDTIVELWFNDGVHGVVDLRSRLFGPLFEPLKDPAVFRRVFVDEFGALCWPNGADLAPDALHQVLAAPAIH